MTGPQIAADGKLEPSPRCVALLARGNRSQASASPSRATPLRTRFALNGGVEARFRLPFVKAVGHDAFCRTGPGLGA